MSDNFGRRNEKRRNKKCRCREGFNVVPRFFRGGIQSTTTAAKCVRPPSYVPMRQSVNLTFRKQTTFLVWPP